MPSTADDKAAPTPEQLAFVEEFALVLERMGLVRMVGRTVGWLLVCEPPEQTFGEIADALRASKGSISTALKTLVTMRWVEKTSKPGDRKDYYTIRPGVMPELQRQQAAQYDDLTATTARGLALFDDPQGPDAARVRDIHDFFVWVAKEIPELIDRWFEQHPRP
ncbi:MarR family transcriptional regulator [Nocardia sp. NPDC048505]|uniref:GbsR/MarR family transcriptional regulator n=1 Tax=unclassified Nocardia TaxID=2637762 RepID=UPI00340C4143